MILEASDAEDVDEKLELVILWSYKLKLRKPPS